MTSELRRDGPARRWDLAGRCQSGGQLLASRPQLAGTLMPPVVVDALLHLHDRVVDETDGVFAVAAIVALCELQLALRSAKVLEGRLHVGLIRAHPASEETCTDSDGHQKSSKETTNLHDISSFVPRIDGGTFRLLTSERAPWNRDRVSLSRWG